MRYWNLKDGWNRDLRGFLLFWLYGTLAALPFKIAAETVPGTWPRYLPVIGLPAILWFACTLADWPFKPRRQEIPRK